MAYAIFERAAARVQHCATVGYFETPKPKKGPKFLNGKVRPADGSPGKFAENPLAR